AGPPPRSPTGLRSARPGEIARPRAGPCAHAQVPLGAVLPRKSGLAGTMAVRGRDLRRVGRAARHRGANAARPSGRAGSTPALSAIARFFGRSRGGPAGQGLFEIQFLASREGARWDTDPLTRRFSAAP